MKVYKNMNERKWKKKIRKRKFYRLRKKKYEKNITFCFLNQTILIQSLIWDGLFNKRTFDTNTELQ